MLTDPLPRTLDFRKAALREAHVSGVLAPADLPRLRTLIAGDDGRIRAEFRFRRDEQGRSIAGLEVHAELCVQCQRCLELFVETVEATSTLAAVLTDEQARQLPTPLEPVVVLDAVDLWDIAEEELVLALPAFSYHADESCIETLAGPAPADEEPAAADAGDRVNPFEVLAQLKGNGKEQAGD